MPHITIEHSADFSKKSISEFCTKIQEIMASIKEGNFDLEQCKARTISFDEYFVGSLNQKASRFLHITIKILAGRTSEVRKKLAQQIMDHVKKTCEDSMFSPSGKDQIMAITEQVADMISGAPNVQMPMQNSDLAGKRCDISIDIVEMDREVYQKARLGK